MVEWKLPGFVRIQSCNLSMYGSEWQKTKSVISLVGNSVNIWFKHSLKCINQLRQIMVRKVNLLVTSKSNHNIRQFMVWNIKRRNPSSHGIRNYFILKNGFWRISFFLQFERGTNKIQMSFVFIDEFRFLVWFRLYMVNHI